MSMFNSFPFYKQSGQMDCGPTCLRMIAKYYGKNYSSEEICNKTHISSEGISILDISEAANAIGFRTLAIKVSYEKLVREAVLPCIVHWSDNHFVVVWKITKGSIKVADPARGLVELKKKDFIQGWSEATFESDLGITLLLEPTPAFHQIRPEKDNQQTSTVRYLFSYVRQNTNHFIQLGLGLLVGSLVQLFFPFLTQSIVDIGIGSHNVSFIYLILGGQLMLTVGKTSVDFLRRWTLLQLSARINISIMSEFLVKLMQLPISFFEQRMIGDLLRRIEDHSRIERFVSSSSLSFLFSFFNVAVFSFVVIAYSWSIFLIYAAGTLLYIAYVSYFFKKRRALDHERFNHLAHNETDVIQLIQGMIDIKLNNCETRKRWAWERTQVKLYDVNVANARLNQYQEAGSLFINELKNVAITFLAAYSVIDGSLTLGMMLALQYMLGQLNSPINELVNFMRIYQDAKISLERITEIHLLNDEKHSDRKPEDDLSETALGDSVDINFKDVSFGYPGVQSRGVLHNINLSFPKGKISAIVGMSGGGKTTLLKLLLGFYSPDSGRVTIGNCGLEQINCSAWRSKCGVVMQDGFVFSDTIANNIALSADEVDFSRLKQAIEISNLTEFLQDQPNGYHTKIGNNGKALSHGQKQRILIARAVYKNPLYLFFDEATSSLDARNEALIMRNLTQFFKDKTVIIIAHRLSTVKNADQIIVLEEGKVAETGSHSQLVETPGAYYDLVSNQLEFERGIH